MDHYYGLLLFICCWIPGFGEIPAPTNVTMDSFNFRNILRWNRPADLEGNVIYTVQYKIDSKSNKIDYQTICITHEQQCDSSVIVFKSYVRVSAQLNSNESEWVTIHFNPYTQTIIGPPKVTVSSKSGNLDVHFVGPLVGIDEESLKEKYGDVIYRVAYWKKSQPADILFANTTQIKTTLHDLEPWTVHCVKVQAYVSEFDKAGDFSPEICKKTTEDGFRKIPKPINVTMHSFNFHHNLCWNRPTDLDDNVIYIVQHKMVVRSNRNSFATICVTPEQQCDCSIITYNSYVRVKAKLNNSTSDWEMMRFDPYSDTIIGPPNITVSPRSGYLDVSFNGPYIGTHKGTLKEKYGDFIYRVEYWKKSEPTNVLIVNTKLNIETLHDLETWTIYCVKVQAYVPEYDKAGDFSHEKCTQTTEDGTTQSWKIAVLFLGSMTLAVIFFLLLIFGAIKAYKAIRYIFLPSYSFPEHLKEYLSKPFYSTPYLPPQSAEECGESCEQLTFVSEEDAS